jgi:hypothetical protein
MSGPGRPTRDDVDKRRRRILHVLVGSAAASEDAIKRLAERMGIGEKALKSDLEALKTELATLTEDELPESLLQAIGVADTYKLLQDLTKKIMAEMTSKTLDHKIGQTLIDAINAQRHMIHAEHEERPQEAVRALELLTPQEEALLQEHRKKLAGPPIQPGEAVPPPSGGEK